MREPTRCTWCLSGNELYIEYHDKEWGVPAWDDRTQFEFLILEGAQAGLSWETILRKREAYRSAFAGFDPAKVARFNAARITRLLEEVDEILGLQEEKKPTPKRPAQASKPAPAKR